MIQAGRPSLPLQERWQSCILIQPNSHRQELQPGQYATYQRLVTTLNISGNDLNDAYLAALALENGLTLDSADPSFTRFPGLKTLNPA